MSHCGLRPRGYAERSSGCRLQSGRHPGCGNGGRRQHGKGAVCMLGAGRVTKTSFKHKLDSGTGILIVKGTATVSGSILNYPYGDYGCDLNNLIASYAISGKANYVAQFSLDTGPGLGNYIFQWMHISFNQ